MTLESLSAQLTAEGLLIASSGALDVDVSASAPGVRLRARRQDDGRLLVRAIPARAGKCEGVERAAVMLIREWARAPKLAAGLPTPADAGIPVRRTERPAPVIVLPLVVEVVEPDASVPEPEPVDAGVVAEPPPVEPAVVDAGLPLVVDVLPLKVPAPWGVLLAVAGGFSAAATPNVVPAGSVVLDIGRGALGGSLDATMEGESVLSAGSGRVATSFQWLTLSARWRFGWLGRLTLDLGVGVRGSRFSATASGFTTNDTVTRLGLGPAATGTFWVRLFGPVELMVRASAALRLPSDSLVIEGGPTFSLSAAQVGAVAGLGVAWP